jgi:hypothetical protein
MGAKPLMSGAAILVECLKKEGVAHIFGYPGGVLIPIFDVLYNTKGIELLLTPMNRGRPMPRTGMPVPAARWESVWPPPAPGPPTW